MGSSKVNGSGKVSRIVKCWISPHLQANKLACQFHRCWQKIQDSWVTEKRKCITHNNSSSHSNIIAPVPWALIPQGDVLRARCCLITQWDVFPRVTPTLGCSDFVQGLLANLHDMGSRGSPDLYYLGWQIYLPLRETISVFQGCLLCKTSLKRESREN